jgi:lipopolysaccharide transport system ATP-binding protein
LDCRLLSPHGGNDEFIWALRDASFTVEPGEAIGIIGRNGSGKSTLLKILSRVVCPTTGRAVLHGRVGSLLEVGTGFHPELTGRENIFLNGAILGMSRAEVRRKFDEMVAFSEIERFLDTPVKRYSSGMYVRLAFAVAAHLDPEILLVDEVLAVGDVAFQRKCLGKISAVTQAGRTVLFVSHNMSAIQNLCRTCLLLDEGQIVRGGSVREVIEYYLSETLAGAQHSDLRHRTDRTGSGRVLIEGFHLENAVGRRIAVAQSGQACTFVFGYRCPGSPCRNVSVAFGVSDTLGAFLFRNYTGDTGQDFPAVAGRGEFRCTVPRLPLRAGRYVLGVRVTVDGEEADYIGGNAAAFDVEGGDFYGSGRQSDHAPVLVDHQWRLTPTTTGAAYACS